MTIPRTGIISRNRVFAWIGVGTGIVLLVPAVAMRFTRQVNWTAADFIVMGVLLFGSASVFVLVARRVPRNYRVAVGVFFVLAFCYVWAELAVGIFTNLGN